MATSCGLFSLFCVLALTLFVVSLALAGDEDARARHDVALARSMHSVPRRGGRRGNERVVADNGGGRRGNRRGHRRNNDGGRRGGRRRGGRGDRGRGGRRERQQMRLVSRLTAASSQFSMDMYNRLKDSHQELVFSPHSIHTALTMTYMGARLRTAKQMMKVLGLKRLRNDKAHTAYAALVNSLTNSGNVTLNVANAVYVRPNLPVEEAFRSGLQDMYKAAFDFFDLEAEGGPEAVINSWVANRTRNKIQNLLSRGTIDQFTAMIIVNAIYFRGAWKDTFNPSSTSQQTFHRDDGSTTMVDLMTQTATYNYTRADDLSSHIVELPYQDGRFSMYVILPVTRNTISDVEASLSVASLNANVQNMRAMLVELFLPKFRTETKFSLKRVLIDMGMRLPFTDRAKFGGISSTAELKISDVIHQAVIEVSEEGTEAAASTAVVISLRTFLPSPSVTVRADHPFIYAIRDNLTKAWIFMGKFSAQGAQG